MLCNNCSLARNKKYSPVPFCPRRCECTVNAFRYALQLCAALVSILRSMPYYSHTEAIFPSNIHPDAVAYHHSGANWQRFRPRKASSFAALVIIIIASLRMNAECEMQNAPAGSAASPAHSCRRNVIGLACLLCKTVGMYESRKKFSSIHIECPLKNKHHVPCWYTDFFNGEQQLHAVCLAFDFFILERVSLAWKMIHEMFLCAWMFF